MDLRDLLSVLDALLDGVILVDPSGRVAHVSAEACRILEMSAEKGAGSTLADLFGPGHPVVALEQQVRSERRAALADDVEIERRHEADVVVDVAVSPIELGDAAEEGLVVELRDHTLRSSMRERHSQREQLQRFGHIAAGIAHEVRNPLGGIRGAAELLQSWSKEERASGAAELIVREVDRISALLDQLGVFARRDELTLRPVNIHRVLDDVLSLLGMDPLSQGIAVERIYDPSIPELVADADRLTQVFLNLLRNALQALEEREGGSVSVTTRVALENRVTRSDGRPVPTVLVTICDTGAGIAPEVLARVATPFFTTRAGGTGLGLAVARQWVTRHDGSLRITSEVGEGTTARVSLPLGGPQTERDADRRSP
jgi:two-component system nitrogen regulation sensor histidine kinase GlnL